MSITTVSKYNPAELSMLRELFQDPYQKDSIKLVPPQPSYEGRIEIIADTQKDPLCFQICWRLNNGTLRVAPFWADAFRGKWCFLNGNPHSFDKLHEMVLDILDHLNKGDIISPKQPHANA